MMEEKLLQEILSEIRVSNDLLRSILENSEKAIPTEVKIATHIADKIWNDSMDQD